MNQASAATIVFHDRPPHGIHLGPALLVLACLAPLSGCTTKALNRRFVNQSLSVTNARYQEMVGNLATVANNPGVLPSFSVLSGGYINVANKYGLDPTMNWDGSGFLKQVLNLSGMHIPEHQWTMTPMGTDPTLRAAHSACLWAINGPPPLGSPASDILRSITYNDDDNPHFGVAHLLAELPPNWLGRGRKCDVPLAACYKSHCHETHVWVMPEQMWALSQFTLVILDIGTVDSKTIYYTPPVATVAYNITPCAAIAHATPQCNCVPPAYEPIAAPPADESKCTCKSPVPFNEVVAGKPTPAGTITKNVPICQAGPNAQIIVQLGKGGPYSPPICTTQESPSPRVRGARAMESEPRMRYRQLHDSR